MSINHSVVTVLRRRHPITSRRSKEQNFNDPNTISPHRSGCKPVGNWLPYWGLEQNSYGLLVLLVLVVLVVLVVVVGGNSK